MSLYSRTAAPRIDITPRQFSDAEEGTSVHRANLAAPGAHCTPDQKRKRLPEGKPLMGLLGRRNLTQKRIRII